MSFINTAPKNKSILRQVIQKEFSDFMEHFDETPVERIQEFRAFLIHWFAVFTPEIFDEKILAEIKSFCFEKDMLSGNHINWFKLLAFEATLFTLTGEERWLSSLIGNLHHETSTLRDICQNSLLLIMSKIYTNNLAFDIVTEVCFRRHFLGLDKLIFLILISPREEDEKFSLLSHLRNRYRDGLYSSMLDNLILNNEPLENPFMKSHIEPLIDYISDRLKEYDIEEGNIDGDFLVSYLLRVDEHPSLKPLAFLEDNIDLLEGEGEESF